MQIHSTSSLPRAVFAPTLRFASDVLQGNIETDRAYAKALLQQGPPWRALEKTQLNLIARYLTARFYPRSTQQDWQTLADDYELALQIYEKFRDLYQQDFLYRQDRLELHEKLLALYQQHSAKSHKAQEHLKKILHCAEKAMPRNEERITELLTLWYKLIDPWKGPPLQKKKRSVKVRTNWSYLI